MTIRQKTLTFNKQNDWILEWIENQVRVRHATGFDKSTSFSKEAIKMLASYILSQHPKAAHDRRIR